MVTPLKIAPLPVNTTLWKCAQYYCKKVLNIQNQGAILCMVLPYCEAKPTKKVASLQVSAWMHYWDSASHHPRPSPSTLP